MNALKPFSPFKSSISLRGSFAARPGRLRLRFELFDPRGEIVGGPRDSARSATEVTRAEELWKATCIEAFWAEIGSPSYWELNLAPSGKQWNLYRLERYRVPQPPAPSKDFSLERFTIKTGVFECELRAQRTFGALEASLCAVIHTASGPHYFSTKHAGEKADFHLRRNFSLKAPS